MKLNTEKGKEKAVCIVGDERSIDREDEYATRLIYSQNSWTDISRMRKLISGLSESLLTRPSICSLTLCTGTIIDKKVIKGSREWRFVLHEEKRRRAVVLHRPRLGRTNSSNLFNAPTRKQRQYAFLCILCSGLIAN